MSSDEWVHLLEIRRTWLRSSGRLLDWSIGPRGDARMKPKLRILMIIFALAYGLAFWIDKALMPYIENWRWTGIVLEPFHISLLVLMIGATGFVLLISELTEAA